MKKIREASDGKFAMNRDSQRVRFALPFCYRLPHRGAAVSSPCSLSLVLVEGSSAWCQAGRNGKFSAKARFLTLILRFLSLPFEEQGSKHGVSRMLSVKLQPFSSITFPLSSITCLASGKAGI